MRASLASSRPHGRDRIRSALATIVVLATTATAALLTGAGTASATVATHPYSGGLSPYIMSGAADLNGDINIDSHDHSNEFFGSTSIIDGHVDCNNWGSTKNAGVAGDGVIDGSDDCTLLAYDGTANGRDITVTDGAFVGADDDYLPTVFPDPATPNNPSPTAARFAWFTINGRVDSNGNGTITGDDCSVDFIDTYDVLGNTGSNPCGFATPPSTASNGLVDLNGDSAITSADSCDYCVMDHDVVNGVVQEFPCDCLDFNGDNRTDVFWHNRNTGKNAIWFLDVTNYLGGTAVSPTAPTSWNPFAVTDVDFDGDGDVFWHNTSTQQNSIWFMNGTNYASSTAINKTTSSTWAPVAAADFDFDGSTDILWHNTSTGKNSVWFLNGTSYAGAAAINKTTSLSWVPVAAADFNGDFTPDILWHNTSTGKNSVWIMDETGVGYVSAVAIDKTAALSWHPYAARDFDNDGNPDILWHNTSTGKNAVWFLNGTTYLSAAAINKTATLDWSPL